MKMRCRGEPRECLSTERTILLSILRRLGTSPGDFSLNLKVWKKLTKIIPDNTWIKKDRTFSNFLFVTCAKKVSISKQLHVPIYKNETINKIHSNKQNMSFLVWWILYFLHQMTKDHWSNYLLLWNIDGPMFRMRTSNCSKMAEQFPTKWQNKFPTKWLENIFTWVCWLRWLPRGEGRHPNIWAPSHPLALDQYTKTNNKQNDYRLNIVLDIG